MKYSSDYKQIALNALKGNWPVAIVTGFLASLMGGNLLETGKVNTSSGSSGGETSIDSLYYELQSTELWAVIYSVLAVSAIVLAVWALITMIIGGGATLGYAVFNLKLIDGEAVSVSDLFSQFYRMWDGFWLKFGMGLYTFLWSCLFIIPGIIKTYSYAMAPYIMAENPGMKADAAITESRRIMDGNKWRLFCLEFSFIGWSLLISAPLIFAVGYITSVIMNGGNAAVLLLFIPCAVFTFVGSLFLSPYMMAAYTAFYRDICYNKASYNSMPEELI